LTATKGAISRIILRAKRRVLADPKVAAEISAATNPLLYSTLDAHDAVSHFLT
jgi:hypothetical protein